MAGPFSERHVYLQWGGTSPGPEIWSCGLRLATKGAFVDSLGIPDAAEMAAWTSGAIKDAVQAFHGSSSTGIHSLCKLTFVKANVVGTDGRYVQDAVNEYVYGAGGISGGNNTNQNPNQIALAISTTTGFKRGPAHRGRFYMPMPAGQVENDGMFSEVYANNVATEAKVFLEAIADVPGVDSLPSLTPHVMSRKVGSPTKRMITGVEVGRVPDTIRRRRNKMKENYKVSVLDLGAA